MFWYSRSNVLRMHGSLISGTLSSFSDLSRVSRSCEFIKECIAEWSIESRHISLSGFCVMVTSPGPRLFSHQRFLTVLRFQPVAVKWVDIGQVCCQTHLYGVKVDFVWRVSGVPCFMCLIFMVFYCFYFKLIPSRIPSYNTLFLNWSEWF